MRFSAERIKRSFDALSWSFSLAKILSASDSPSVFSFNFSSCFGPRSGWAPSNSFLVSTSPVAAATTYESGEGDAVIIPVPIEKTKTVSTGRRNRRGSGAKTKVVVVDDTELSMYGGK